MLLVLFFAIIIILQLIISAGILIESKRSKDVSQRLFVAVSLSFLLWTISLVVLTFVDSKFTQSNLGLFNLFNKLGYSLGAISLVMTYIFNLYYPIKKTFLKKDLITIFVGILLAILSFSEQVSGVFLISGDGALVYKEGIFAPLFIVFALYILVSIIYGNIKLLRGSSDKNLIEQVRTVLIGLTLTIVHALLFIVVLAPLFENNQYIYDIGYMAPYYYILFTIHGLVNQRLFDIRLIVFRAVVYTFSIVSIGLIYSAAVFGVSSLFIDVSNVTYPQRALFAVLALLIALTYTPILNFFNKITTRLFFRDAYDSQDVLDRVGKIIVGSIDLHKIQKSSLEVISGALRPTYAGFVLKSTTGGIDTQDFVGDTPHLRSDDLLKLTKVTGKKVVIYDELRNSTLGLDQLMRASNISLVMPLITKNEIVGYLIMGSKKSGNVYNQQDKSVLVIIANELAVALQNAQRFEEIQAFNITLQEKVNEATRELKVTNKKLIALDEAKDEFISMASHQLRTPLTSIKGYLSMMLEGDLGKTSAAQTKAIKEAFGSSQRMVYLISDFLNVSRIKTGKFVIEPKEVNLPEVVGEEIHQLRELAESRDVTLEYEAPGEFPQVKLDDNKIRQVMMNMVDNAIYYTPANGTVQIQLYVNADDVVFKVVDTGIGVPKEEQHKLFTKFFRAGNARVARPDGTGLGLFMAQKIIVEQGGSIIFESTEGKGSTFGFRFPLKSIKL